MKLTFGKDLILSGVVHVPSLTKKLIYGLVLSKKGFKLIFELDKVVITKGGVFVGKGYLHEGLFKLSVVNNDVAANVYKNKADSSSASSVYMIDLPFYLWHSRLGHVNFRSIKE